MHAIGRDEYGRADIDYDKCVSCGMCLVNCPFGAIADKSQLFQVVNSIKNGDKLIAILAPACWGQFGDGIEPGQILNAMTELGFTAFEEVAKGADLCAIVEAREYIEEVPGKKPFLATSCCPAWYELTKLEFPDLKDCISNTLTPMLLMARLCKKYRPECKVVFVGPCTAKKLEASRDAIRSDVDFVITFEELQGMFDAKGINVKEMPSIPTVLDASKLGIGFAASSGVAAAVEKVVRRLSPETNIQTEFAQDLDECRRMLLKARAGKYNSYLLEGMACPGGCVAGAGTIQAPEKTVKNLRAYQDYSTLDTPLDSVYLDELRDVLEERGKKMPE